MFSFFKKKSKETIESDITQDWSFLKTDIHSHLIPGIDDGVESVEESLSLLNKLKEVGFSKVVTTPHISQDYYPNTEEEILYALRLLKEAVTKSGLEIELHAAAEYMIDETFMAKLSQNKPLLKLDDKHVLIEMGFVQESPLLMQAIFELVAKGYIPVLAHPERYNFYMEGNAIEKLKHVKDAGCLLQLNSIALVGYYGKYVKNFAEKILEAGLYDFAGSDIHHERHLHAVYATLKTPVFKTLYEYPFLNKSI
jgi:protein-tyrosine phosphatase